MTASRPDSNHAPDTNPPPWLDARAVAEYTRDMLDGLKHMAERHELQVLFYLLDASRREADRILRKEI